MRNLVETIQKPKEQAESDITRKESIADTQPEPDIAGDASVPEEQSELDNTRETTA